MNCYHWFSQEREQWQIYIDSFMHASMHVCLGTGSPCKWSHKLPVLAKIEGWPAQVSENDKRSLWIYIKLWSFPSKTKECRTQYVNGGVSPGRCGRRLNGLPAQPVMGIWKSLKNSRENLWVWFHFMFHIQNVWQRNLTDSHCFDTWHHDNFIE